MNDTKVVANDFINCCIVSPSYWFRLTPTQTEQIGEETFVHDAAQNC